MMFVVQKDASFALKKDKFIAVSVVMPKNISNKAKTKEKRGEFKKNSRYR